MVYELVFTLVVVAVVVVVKSLDEYHKTGISHQKVVVSIYISDRINRRNIENELEYDFFNWCELNFSQLVGIVVFCRSPLAIFSFI